MTGASAGVGVSSGLLARLSPYQVGLCSLLLQYAQEGLHRSKASERRMLELLLREVQKSEGPRHKALVELRRDLCAEVDGGALWDALISRLREIDSPDALFETFHGLGAAIARDFTAPAALHGSGVFGHFARRCVLAFKDASFEASVKLFDAVREYVEAYDEQTRAAQDSIRAGSKVEGADAGGLGAAAADQLALGVTQLEELARGLMHDLPLSFGRVSFPVIDKALAALQGKLPLCHVVHFLRYVNSLQHRLADDAGSCLRSFHDGHQQRGLAEMRTASGWSLGVPSEDGLPDLIQYASLALAGLHSEMRHLDDALQAIGESIRAAQEASDGGCLCACLYMLSLVLLQAGHTGKAFTMMRRCLHRAESLGLPMIQSLCCLGIARTLSVQPSLSDRRQRGLLWKESISRMPGDVQPAAVLRVHGSAGGGAGGAGGAWSGAAGAAGGVARIFGYAGTAGGLGSARGGGLGVLAALLGQTQQEEGAGAAGGGRGGQGGDANEGAACRDALAHVTLASQLSTWAGPASEARPKVLLCQAEVARVFGLRPLAAASCRTALDIYHQELATEDRAIALCQLAAAASEHSLAEARPLLRGVAQELPHASHLWAHIVGPRVIHALTRAGESSAASALLFQAAGLVRAVPHDAAASAAQQLRLAVNGVRLYNGHLLSAYHSARDAVESGAARSGNPGDVCSHLLCLVDVHLEAQDPIGALGPCLRCISAAENCRLLHFRAEALVRLARIKLEMRDLVGALQLAEEVTPQLAASGSERLRGEALMVQADVLFAAIARHQDDSIVQAQLLREIEIILRSAADAFEAVAELNALRRCHYLLARTQHQLGNAAARDRHAACFRRVSEYLEGKRGSWREDGGASPFDVAEQATAEGAVDRGPTARCPALAELISMAAGARPGGAAAPHGDGRPLAAGQREEGTATVVGATRALYPMTAVLGV